MSAPFKVLVFSIFITIFLILVVLFNFDVLKFKTVGSSSATSSSAESSENTKPKMAAAVKDTSKQQNIDLENGKKLYDSKTCVLCHGADGKSSTPMGKAVNAADITAKKFKANKDNLPRFEYLLHVIENGVPGTAMVSFKSQIPQEQDRVDLAGYVNSLSTN